MRVNAEGESCIEYLDIYDIYDTVPYRCIKIVFVINVRDTYHYFIDVNCRIIKFQKLNMCSVRETTTVLEI